MRGHGGSASRTEPKEPSFFDSQFARAVALAAMAAGPTALVLTASFFGARGLIEEQEKKKSAPVSTVAVPALPQKLTR